MSAQDAVSRSFLRLDLYAIDDMTLEYRLRSNERDVLLTIVRRGFWETHEWSGTFEDLARWTGLTRKTVPMVLGRLLDKNLIVVIESFGRSSKGRLGIVCWDRLVVPNARASKRERVVFASTTRPLCVVYASDDAKSPHDSNDLRQSRGREAVREKRSGVCIHGSPLDGPEACFTCCEIHFGAARADESNDALSVRRAASAAVAS